MRGGFGLYMLLIGALFLAAPALPLQEPAAAQTSSPSYPLIHIEHPPQGAVVRGNVEFYGRIVDPNLASVSARWWMDDGDPSPVKLVDGTWRINWTAIGPDQTHIFHIQATNRLNETVEESRVFRFEPQEPGDSKLVAWLRLVSVGVTATVVGGIVVWRIRKRFEPRGDGTTTSQSIEADVEPISVSWGNQTKPDNGTTVNFDVRVRCQPGPSTSLDYCELVVENVGGSFIFQSDRTIRRITGERNLSVPSGQVVEFHLRFEHPDWLDIAGRRAIVRVFLVGAQPKTMEFSFPAINVRTQLPARNAR